VSDEERARWQQRKRDGEHAVISGLVQLAMSIPILIVGGVVSFIAGKYALVFALITVGLGLAAIGRGAIRIIRGALRAGRATRELADLQRAQLPEARVVDR